MKVKFKTIGIRSSEDALKDAAEAMQSIWKITANKGHQESIMREFG